MSIKSTAACDVECYPNFFLIGFCNVETGNKRVFKAYGENVGLSGADIAAIRNILAKMRIITFNGRNYDFPMITYALTGATCKQLKACSDAIIVEGLKFWHIEKRFKIRVPREEVDHVDLIDVAFGVASLKIYGGRLHSKKIQDLPFDPGRILSPQDALDLEDYWGNDITTTIDLFNALKPELELREAMTKEYGIDLRSKSDAQIAEAIIKSEVEKSTGIAVTRPQSRCGDKFQYRVPLWVSFDTPQLQAVLERVRQTTFVVDADGKVGMPASLEDLTVTISDRVYRLGIGGIHSSEEKIAHHADEENQLSECDVTSYYPSIMLNQGLFPLHIGKDFLTVYRSIYDRRIAAKKAGEKKMADMLKVPQLGVFGKMNNKWSPLNSPESFIQVVLTGQLASLMLIERIETRMWSEVVSANTDGIVIKCPRWEAEELKSVIGDWEMVTGFTTEDTQYDHLYSANVNNYVAIKSNGEIKTKGSFQFDGLRKNPTNMICNDAAINFLTLGLEPEYTVAACDDVRRFVTIRQVKGGAVTEQGEYLGKAVRWYYSTRDAASCIRYVTNGNLVAGSTGSAPLMELCEGLPADLDRDWYVRESYDILKDIGATT